MQQFESHTLDEKDEKKEYVVNIPHLLPRKPFILLVSPDQSYYNGDLFKATLKYLHDNDIETIIVVADELYKDSENDPAVQEQVKTLEEAWPSTNLELDEENRVLYENMKERERIRIMGWKECRNEFKTEYSTFLPLLEELYKKGEEEDDEKSHDFHTKIKKAAQKYFNTVCEKQQNKPQFFLYRQKKTDKFIIETYLKYLLEEAAIMAAWDDWGFEQMGYPYDRNEISLEVYNAIFNAINTIRQRSGSSLKPHTTLRLLGVEIKEKHALTKQALVHKKNVDPAALTQKEQYIGVLRLQRRKLQEELTKEKMKNSKIVQANQETESNLQQQLNRLDELEKLSLEYFRSIETIESEKGVLLNLSEKQRSELNRLHYEIKCLKNILYSRDTDIVDREDHIRYLESSNASKDRTIHEYEEIIRRQEEIIHHQGDQLRRPSAVSRSNCHDSNWQPGLWSNAETPEIRRSNGFNGRLALKGKVNRY
jgi:hypothetical protein